MLCCRVGEKKGEESSLSKAPESQGKGRKMRAGGLSTESSARRGRNP